MSKALFNLKLAKSLCSLLGYKGLKSMSEMYKGGTYNAFGHPQSSARTLTLEINASDRIVGIDLHAIYVKPTPEVLSLVAEIAKHPEGMTLTDCIAFVSLSKTA